MDCASAWTPNNCCSELVVVVLVVVRVGVGVVMVVVVVGVVVHSLLCNQ